MPLHSSKERKFQGVWFPPVCKNSSHMPSVPNCKTMQSPKQSLSILHIHNAYQIPSSNHTWVCPPILLSTRDILRPASVERLESTSGRGESTRCNRMFGLISASQAALCGRVVIPGRTHYWRKSSAIVFKNPSRIDVSWISKLVCFAQVWDGLGGGLGFGFCMTRTPWPFPLSFKLLVLRDHIAWWMKFFARLLCVDSGDIRKAFQRGLDPVLVRLIDIEDSDVFLSE